MTGYLLTVLMSCKGELAFYSGEGTRETSTTFMKVLTRFNEGLNKVFQGPFEYAPPQRAGVMQN